MAAPSASTSSTAWTSISTGGTFYIDSFAFQEVNIQTANMSAERSTGGVVWMFVTKTGSNQFHGTGAFLGMTHGCCEADNINDETEAILLAAVPPYALAADPTPSLGNSVEHMYDLSGTVGGPIIRDRLWFTFAGKLGEVYQRRVGSYNADGTQLLSDNQLRQTTAKVSFAINPSQQLHYVQSWVHKGRYHVAGGPNVTEFFSNEATTLNPARHWFHLARWTNVLSQKSVLDVAVSFAYGNNHLLPQPEVKDGDIAKFDAVTRINTGARRTYQWQPGNRGNIHTSLSYYMGDHDMKVGWQYIRSDVSSGVFLTSHAPAGLNAIYRNGVPDSVNTYNAPNDSTRKFYTNGIYFQDQWRPHRKLTVNIGLRYENAYGWINDGESPLCLETNVFVQGACFPAVKGVPDFHGFVPRMSMIYDLFGNGRTALKFSANQYKERVTETYLTRINPIGNASDTRTWTDANRDLIPQLNELGPSSGFNIGTTNRYATDLKWPTTNELDFEVEQELAGKIVVGAGYFYRAYRDQIGQKNEAVPTSGYIPLTVTEVTTGHDGVAVQPGPGHARPVRHALLQHAGNEQDVSRLRFERPEAPGQPLDVDGKLRLRARQGFVRRRSEQSRTTPSTAMASRRTSTCRVFVEGRRHLSDAVGHQRVGQLPVLRRLAGNDRRTGWRRYGPAHPDQSERGHRAARDRPHGRRQPARPQLQEGVRLRGSGMRLEPRLDIYNLLNGATVTDRIQQLGPSYHNVIELLGARMIKLGANFNW